MVVNRPYIICTLTPYYSGKVYFVRLVGGEEIPEIRRGEFGCSSLGGLQFIHDMTPVIVIQAPNVSVVMRN